MDGNSVPDKQKYRHTYIILICMHNVCILRLGIRMTDAHGEKYITKIDL